MAKDQRQIGCDSNNHSPFNCFDWRVKKISYRQTNNYNYTCICYNTYTSVTIEITSRSEFSQYCAVGTVLSLSADSGLFVQALASKCIGLEKHHLVSSQPLRNQQQKDVTLFKRVFFLFPRTLFVKHLFLFFFFFDKLDVMTFMWS